MNQYNLRNNMNQYNLALIRDIIIFWHKYSDVTITSTYENGVKDIMTINFRYKKSLSGKWSSVPTTININKADIRDYKINKLLS